MGERGEADLPQPTKQAHEHQRKTPEEKFEGDQPLHGRSKMGSLTKKGLRITFNKLEEPIIRNIKRGTAIKKQLLFLLTILLAITPACTKRQKRASADSSIAAGTVLTAAGTSTTIAGGVIAAQVATLEMGAAIGVGMIMVALPIAVLIGLPLLITGVLYRKKFKKEQMLEKLKQEKVEQNLSE